MRVKRESVKKNKKQKKILSKRSIFEILSLYVYIDMLSGSLINTS